MTNWTPKMDETLRSLWLAGCSAGVIGKSLGTTRDAVLGRARRLGLNRAGSATTVSLPSHPERKHRAPLVALPLPREAAVWAADEDRRRHVFAVRASSGARAALEAIGQ